MMDRQTENRQPEKVTISPSLFLNKRSNNPVAHLRLFVLSNLMVTFLKNETYGYGNYTV